MFSLVSHIRSGIGDPGRVPDQSSKRQTFGWETFRNPPGGTIHSRQPFGILLGAVDPQQKVFFVAGEKKYEGYPKT